MKTSLNRDSELTTRFYDKLQFIPKLKRLPKPCAKKLL